jgi:hypothetical protein
MFTIGHETNLKAERKQCLGKVYDFYGTGIRVRAWPIIVYH